MTLREKVEKCLEDMSFDDLISVFNEYCRTIECYEDEFYYMDEFDDLFCGLTPLRIAEIVEGTDFNPRHDFFRETIYGVESYCSSGDVVDEINAQYIEELINHIVDNGDALDNNELADVIREGDDEEEDSED